MSKKHKHDDHKQELHHHHDHEDCCHHDHGHDHDQDDFEACEEFDFDMDGPTDDTVLEMTHMLTDAIGHLTEVCVEAELASGNKLRTEDVLKIYDQVSEKVMANIQKIH